MSAGHSQTAKNPSKAFLERPMNWFKKKLNRPHSQSTSPQPPAHTQEHRGEARSYAQDADHFTTISNELSKSPLITSSSGVTGSVVAQDQHSTSTNDRAASAGAVQLHESTNDCSVTPAYPEKMSSRALSTAKDVAGVGWSFTAMLLKRLPDAVDMNPIKIAAGIVKIVLQIKDEVTGNIDAVDKRIFSIVEQLITVEKALDGWQPNKAEEMQGMKLYQSTLLNEWTNLIDLKNQSIIRKIAVHEDDKGKIADIFEHINQAREQLVLVTGLRVHKTVIAIQDDVAKILLEGLEPSHAADHKYELEGEQRQLLRRAVCTSGTRTRILGDVVRWANDITSESQSVYWLSGQGGSGKSTIAYTIARRFDFARDVDDTIVLGGNFFCSRQIMETKSAFRIIRTIVYQLAFKCKAFADTLRAFGKFDTIHHGVRAQLEGLLIKPWKQAQPPNSSKTPLFLVVIDALDEIEGTGGSEFLRDLLDVINKNCLPGLKFFVTSRPDPNLVAHLSSFKDKQFCRLERVPINEAQGDITTYLNANLPHFVGRPEMEKLVTQAAGLFIYAATVVKYLADYQPLEQKERLNALPLVTGSGIHQTSEETPLLDSLYLQILFDAFHLFKSKAFEQRLQILHTFLCSAERISTSVVSELLFPQNGNDESDPAFSYIKIADDVVARLHAVLYKENDNVFSYHKSFTDFIFDRNRAKEYSFDQPKHHQHLSDSCFLIMMERLKFNIANIESSFILDCHNSTLREAVKQNISPVLGYSCQNWDYHLLAVEPVDSDALRDSLMDFLQLHVLFWIEAMNLLGSRGQCEQMLQKAHKWVLIDDNILREELAEAASFALYFSGSGAASSTPHLYISALATWPGDVWPCQSWKMNFPRIPKFKNAILTEEPLMTLEGGSPVLTVACSGDGKQILSGSEDKLVRVWDAATGKMLKMLEGHTKAVLSVGFSSNDKYIISSSSDKSVRVWDASTGKMLEVLEGHTETVWSVAFSGDNKHIVSGSEDKSIRVWDPSTGKMSKVLEGHAEAVLSVAFSSNNIHIASGSSDTSVRLWDVSTGEMLMMLSGHTETVFSIAFSSDGTRIASGSSDKSVRVWDASTGKMVEVLSGHTDDVWSVAFSSDNKYIVSGSEDKSIRVWDTSTGKTLKMLEGHTEAIFSAVFSSNDKRIISGSSDKLVRVWDASTRGVLKVLEGHTETVWSVSFSNDNKHIVSGSEDKSVRLWDASKGKMLNILEGHTEAVFSVVFSNNDNYILSGSEDKSVRLWDALTGRILRVLKGHMETVWSVGFSSDDKAIVSGSEDKSVRVWDASTGRLQRVLEGHTLDVLSVTFSSNDDCIISGSSDNSVRMWHTSTGEMLRVIAMEGYTAPALSLTTSNDVDHAVSDSRDKCVSVTSTSNRLKVLQGHIYHNNVFSVAFSSNNNHIVSGSKDRMMRLWDASTHNILNILEGHNGPVLSVTFSRNGNHIVSGSEDKSVQIWDASTGKALRMLEGHTGPVFSVAFSSDDNRIVSGSSDKSIRVWALPTQLTSLDYVRQKLTDSESGYPKHSGWLLSPNGEHYLMFVPLAANLPDLSNVLTLPRSYAPSIDFSFATLGSQWSKCFTPVGRSTRT